VHYADYAIDPKTLDEIWRLLCVLVGREEGPRAAAARPAEREPDAELRVADFASSFGDG